MSHSGISAAEHLIAILHLYTQLFIYTLYQLTFSPPMPLRLCTLPYWSNPSFLISDIRALWCSAERQSARMSEIKNDELDQYGAEHLEQQQFGTAGVEGVNYACLEF